MSRVTNILLDLSGTLHIADAPTQGAVAALDRLRKFISSLDGAERGRVNLRFCSNASKESSEDVLKRLHRVGFTSIQQQELVTSLDACARTCVAKKLSPLLLLTPSAASSPSFSGLSHSFSAHIHSSPSSLTPIDRAALERCDAVVIGLAPEALSYGWVNEAFRLVSGEYSKEGKKAALVATHRAKYFRPAPEAPLALGPGPFITALEEATGTTAKDTIVCGKPSVAFFQACLTDMRGSERDAAEETIIVGDDVEQDLGGGAIELGFKRVLVKTGKYRRGDETRLKPDEVHDSFAAWVDAAFPT